MGRSGRSGGGSSGGRSGGSRSGGGRSSFGSGRSGRSSSSSSSSNRSSSSKGTGFFGSPYRSTPRRTKNIFINNVGNKYNSRGSNNFGGSNNSKGCLTSLIVILIITVILGLVFMSVSGESSDVTHSTIEREALPKGSVVETGYFTDELEWIKNKTELEKGLKHFYDKTGVQPYLYITDNVEGKPIYSAEELKPFTEKLYGELFEDEAHLLLVFYEYAGDYAYYFIAGAQAKTVVDSEAADILMDYLDRYYYSDMSEEEMFSTAFSNAADDMMEIYKSPWVNVFMIIAVAVVIGIIFIFWKSAKKQKNKEAEQMEKILNTDLNEFGDSKIDDLEEKYK